MFGWIFGKKKNNNIEDLVAVLKNGINININISGNINVEQERGNSLEERKRERQVDTYTTKVEEDAGRAKEEEEISTIPNFSKLTKPEVNFGEEKEV